jgi:hypothetical protein
MSAAGGWQLFNECLGVLQYAMGAKPALYQHLSHEPQTSRNHLIGKRVTALQFVLMSAR